MGQTKRLSIIESMTQSVVSFIMTMLVLIIALDDLDLIFQIKLGLIFLVVNIVRQYSIRRIFSCWDK